MEIDKKIISKLIKVLEELKASTKDMTDIKYIKEENVSIDGEDENLINIKSPIVGTAYLAPEPGAKKFIEVGKKIKKGQTLMIIEAMKTMNHIPSTDDGIVKKICLDDGDPVEFGQIIVILK